jgi:hypothetical protein
MQLESQSIMDAFAQWKNKHNVATEVEDVNISEPNDFYLKPTSAVEGPAENTEGSNPDMNFYVLDTDSTIDTKNPMENEFVQGWNKDGSSMQLYILVGRVKPWILAGSGNASDYGIKVGATIDIHDDGNGTTKFKWKRGTPIVVKAIANGAEEIKKFPEGTYQLRVMK